MSDRSTAHPTAPADLEAYLARFAWHPEPELIGYRDAGASREALERLGAETWAAALDFLFDHAVERAMGAPSGYAPVRPAFYGAAGVPPGGPPRPPPSRPVLAEARARPA